MKEETDSVPRLLLPLLWLLESGLVAIARLLLYLRLLGQGHEPVPQLTRRLSAGEPHARVRGPCAQFGGMGLSMSSSLCRLPSSFQTPSS